METVVLTRAYKRYSAWFVEGRVLKQGAWVDASFTASAADVEHMSREDFRAFALRQLPNVTHDLRYTPTGEVIAA